MLVSIARPSPLYPGKASLAYPASAFGGSRRLTCPSVFSWVYLHSYAVSQYTRFQIDFPHVLNGSSTWMAFVHAAVLAMTILKVIGSAIAIVLPGLSGCETLLGSTINLPSQSLSKGALDSLREQPTHALVRR